MAGEQHADPRAQWLAEAIEATRRYIDSEERINAEERPFAAPFTWDYDRIVDSEAVLALSRQTLERLEAEAALVDQRLEWRATRVYED